jgi:hypothetical protein
MATTTPVPFNRLVLLFGLALLLMILLLVRWISGWGLITLHVADAPLGKVLGEIARQGHVRVESSLDPLKSVTLDVEKVTPAEALDTLTGNVGASWRALYLAAPDKASLESAVVSLRSGGTVEGWTLRYYPLPPFFLETGGETIDPRRVEWIPEGPGPELSKLLDEAAQKCGIMTGSPDAWSPSLPHLPKEGLVGKSLSSMISSVHGRSLELFLVTERRSRGPGDAPPEGGGPPPLGSGEMPPPGQAPTYGDRGARQGGGPSQIRPEWMVQRLQASAKSLPKGVRQKALQEVDEFKPLLDQLKGLSPQERRDKMREMMANPEFAEKMADRMQARDSKRSPDQRINRAVGYLNKKAAQKAAGQ